MQIWIQNEILEVLGQVQNFTKVEGPIYNFKNFRDQSAKNEK
jgi:hypothetical protein